MTIAETRPDHLDLVEHYFEQAWSDGLPVVAPTAEKAEAIVEALGGDPGRLEARVPARWGSFTRMIHRRDILRASKIMQGRPLAHPRPWSQRNPVVTEVLGESAVSGLPLENTSTAETDAVETAAPAHTTTRR